MFRSRRPVALFACSLACAVACLPTPSATDQSVTAAQPQTSVPVGEADMGSSGASIAGASNPYFSAKHCGLSLSPNSALDLCVTQSTASGSADASPLVLRKCDGTAAQHWVWKGSQLQSAAGQCLAFARQADPALSNARMVTCDPNDANQLVLLQQGTVSVVGSSSLVRLHTSEVPATADSQLTFAIIDSVKGDPNVVAANDVFVVPGVSVGGSGAGVPGVMLAAEDSPTTCVTTAGGKLTFADCQATSAQTFFFTAAGTVMQAGQCVTLSAGGPVLATCGANDPNQQVLANRGSLMFGKPMRQCLDKSATQPTDAIWATCNSQVNRHYVIGMVP